MEEIFHFVNGKDYISNGEGYFEIYNPSLGKKIRKIKTGTAQDVDFAVKIAQKAQIKWEQTPPAKRVQVMLKFLRLLEEDIEIFAKLVAEEHGKTISDAKGSIARGLEVLEFCLGATQFLKSDFSANVANNVDTYNLRQPLGVCAGITPFNFPAMVPMWMYPIALCCGNAFILKPSEKVPSAALYQAKKIKEAGLPDGLLNVIVGDKVVVDALLEHPEIQSISFVGSTTVGEYVFKKGAQQNKKVQALCGAKNHLVVMPDADVTQVVDALIGSAYGSAGERCMAISVVVAVGDSMADQLVANLVPRVQSLKIGSYESKETEMGPIISQEALSRIESLVHSGVEEGAKLVVDGRNIQVEGYPQGFFLGGCLFDRVRPEMKIYKTEIFGPVLCVVRVKNYEEALQLVNDHEYGNGVAIFTRDGDSARHFSMHAKIGMVGVNVPIPVPVAYHSFGGWKRSSFGGHAIYGMEGVRFYTKLKTITTRWPSGIREGSEFFFVRGSEQ